jgi:predicted nucleic acid-binding protein
VILIDTSVWVDHFRSGDDALVSLLNAGTVLAHPHVIGEIALGQLKQRELVLRTLYELPQTTVATDSEVHAFIESEALFGFGIGYVDAHLLASVRLTSGASLWTRDKKLAEVAERLKLAANV